MFKREPPKAPFSFFPSICLMLCILARILIRINKNNLIIQYGIKGYRTLNTFVFIVLILDIIVCCGFLFWCINYYLKKAKKKPVTSQQDAILSISKNLDSYKLQKTLSEYMQCKKWQPLVAYIETCKNQLEAMDEEQRKLNCLLENNGANNLSDTKNVLDQVEQYMCKCIRKVMNYMQVADPNTDLTVLQTKLNACATDCQKQLDQVKEFLFIMAEFLNKQGGDDNTPETLEIYKDTILKSIHGEL